MKLLFVLSFLFGSLAMAQLDPKTEVCYPAAVKVASNKIAKDARDGRTVLSRIGFKAEECSYNEKEEAIVCYDAKGVAQFDVVFDYSKVNSSSKNLAKMSFQFKTGTQGLNVYYVLSFVKKVDASSCYYLGTTVYTEDYED